jgi:hypothetical protein
VTAFLFQSGVDRVTTRKSTEMDGISASNGGRVGSTYVLPEVESQIENDPSSTALTLHGTGGTDDVEEPKSGETFSRLSARTSCNQRVKN